MSPSAVSTSSTLYGSSSAAKRCRGLVARDLLAAPSVRPSFSSRSDLLLDPLEILLADRLGEVEVVVEAVLDRRADRDLHARIEPRARPRRAGAPRSGGGRRARPGRPCRASSGAGSARRRRAAGADPAPVRSRGRARPARRASARSRARRRARSRRREVRALSCREGRPSWQNRPRICTPAKTTGTRRSTSRRRPIPKRETRSPRTIRRRLGGSGRWRRGRSPARNSMRIQGAVCSSSASCRETSTKPARSQARTAPSFQA